MEETPDETPKPELTEVSAPEVNTPETSQPKTKRFKKFHKPSKKQAIIMAIVAAVLIGGGVAFALTKPKAKPATSTQQSPAAAAPAGPAVTLTGTNFFDAPKELPDQKFFKDLSYFGQSCTGDNNTGCEPNVLSQDIHYYQVGTIDADKLVVTNYTKSIDGWEYIARVKADGGVAVFLNPLHSSEYDAKNTPELKKLFADTITLDDTTTIPELKFPTELEVAGQKIKGGSYYYLTAGGLGSIRGSGANAQNKGGTPKKIGEVNGKTFYEVVSSDKPTFSINEIYATIKGVYSSPYQLNGEVGGQTAAVTYKWTSGEKNNSTYFSASGGCGSSNGYVVAKNITKGDLLTVGTTLGGQKIYQLSTSSALAQELFNADYAKGDNLTDDSLKNLSIQQFTDKHGYMIVENGLGEYTVFLRSDLVMRGGCGKPVVYLYPTSTTSVSVKVGAQVSLSDPHYTKDGWQNVLASPNGNLLYQGVPYRSLFWEGYGNGVYPEITQGTVVASDQAATTIRNQLAAQGLNTNEIQDFMTFWQPKLPTTPYVRLTWFGNTQLNVLAPLNISPRPQTLIRTFLDFEGLQQPTTIAPQTFSAPKRQGFTAVEWGGLLRNGLAR